LGRKAEDGKIKKKYPLTETSSAEYIQRTEANVKDNDATLLIFEKSLDQGSIEAYDFCRNHQKLYLMINLSEKPQAVQVRKWIESCQIETLNIAGPRESNCPGIYKKSKSFIESVFKTEE
jgi:Circularly permutated YpsA SLOG family